MVERIGPGDPLSRANGCGNFSCTDKDLVAAMRATRSNEVGVVGLYLAMRYALEPFEVSDIGFVELPLE